MSEDDRKETITRTFRLDKDLNDWIDEKHISIGKLINSLIRDYRDQEELGKADPHISKRDLASPNLSQGGPT